MLHVRLKAINRGVALVAAYMLVLQGLFGAFALGTAAASPSFDAFGNPICITAADHGEAFSDDAGHATLPDCCTIACGMFAPATADDRIAHFLTNPLVAAGTALHPPFDAAGYRAAPQRGPGSPRSPPPAA